ncbi:MAG: SDR family NAD(P)-dependent oxidoreductase [Betaproteobacteria bacterium]|nr:SDR family NAD(P)-dependent oxidoreductase [Betaproteobacteria bacterium]
MAEKRIAVVTGANRGIGFEICRQLARKGLRVVLTARNETRGKAAQRKLSGEGLEVAFLRLDVTSARDDRREKTDPVRVRENSDFLTLERIKKCPKECV